MLIQCALQPGLTSITVDNNSSGVQNSVTTVQYTYILYLFLMCFIPHDLTAFNRASRYVTERLVFSAVLKCPRKCVGLGSGEGVEESLDSLVFSGLRVGPATHPQRPLPKYPFGEHFCRLESSVFYLANDASVVRCFSISQRTKHDELIFLILICLIVLWIELIQFMQSMLEFPCTAPIETYSVAMIWHWESSSLLRITVLIKIFPNI